MKNSDRVITVLGVNRASLFASRLTALLLAGVFASPSSAGDFFDGPAATPGDPMFFSIYSILKEQKGNFNLEKISDGGFTTAGPHYLGSNGGDPIGNPTAFYGKVADAAEEGLGIIAHITWHPSVINDTSGNIRPDSMDAIPEADVRAHVRQVMDFTLNDSVANSITHKWYTMPEELRPWKAGEMNYLSIIVDEVKNYDPQGRPVSMYNPNHRTTSELNTIVGQGLDETLMGAYVTSVPFATRGARLGLGFDRILASAANTSTTPIFGAQLSTDFDPAEITALRATLGNVPEADAIKHVIRHDVYQGLLRGIDGVQIWSGHDNRPGLTTFSDQLDGYISVSEDMNLGLGLADVFLQGEDRTDFQATVLAGPTTVSYIGGPANYTVDTVTLADKAYEDDRYLFLANSSNSVLAINVDGLPSGVPQITDIFGNAPELIVDSSTGTMTLAMQPLEVVGLKIESVWNADANGDGVVDGADLLAWQTGFGASGSTTVAGGDFNYDGVVDSGDLTVWESQYGLVAPLTTLAAAVPEPSTGPLMIGSSGLLLLRRRRRVC